jgi:exopolysaccharide production repressor protein
MSILVFLRGFVGAILSFAVITYVVSGSLWTTLMQTAICALLIQIGYFAAIIFLMWRGRRRKAQARNMETARSFSEKARPVAKS